MGKSWVDQEYRCLFTAMEGLVYPEFEQCIVPDSEAAALEESAKAERCGAARSALRTLRRVGGIDFGFRNPFAAVWGVLDRDDVLHLYGERYATQTPLHEHARALPAGYEWYADPAGRTEIEELRAAGHKVLPGQNELRLGIAAVTARIRTGRLKVYGCPNLVAEARRYRYPAAGEAVHEPEHPIDADNHALAALRYLVSRIDARFLARLRGGPVIPAPATRRPRRWLRLDNDAIFEPRG
jgi:hypothetical protein